MTSPDQVVIDGVTYDVIVRESAKTKTPLNDELVTLKTVDMLLLSNDQVVYQCVHPGALVKCVFIADAVQSVTAHQRSHSAKTVAKKAAAQLAEVAAKEQAEFSRRSAGMQRANAEKKARHANDVTATDPKVQLVQRLLSDLGVAISKEQQFLGHVRESLTEISKSLTEFTSATTEPAAIDVDKMSTEEKFTLVKKLMS